MLATTYTVAFSGVDVLKISTEVQLTNGLPSFTIVGLADKAIAESRERVRAALHSLGMMLPAQHITVNLAPADVVKEGTHYDLPIAVALLAAMGVIEPTVISSFIMMGELGLDGSVRTVSGVLPAAMAAMRAGMGIVCPAEQGKEAGWSEATPLLAPQNLIQLINYFKNNTPIPMPSSADTLFQENTFIDLSEIKGQEIAKRALEVAAVGGEKGQVGGHATLTRGEGEGVGEVDGHHHHLQVVVAVFPAAENIQGQIQLGIGLFLHVHPPALVHGGLNGLQQLVVLLQGGHFGVLGLDGGGALEEEPGLAGPDHP